ncbi:MAG: hypothetical protein PHV77_07060 [Candidatus Omnitrophica bacterium]|jgi:hypothetical protein|nr:hypothetical protein [Candidatus Omnitrophota bacterium]
MNKKRIFLYFIILVVFIVMVIIRQGQVRCNRAYEIMSVYAQYQKHGKPVFAKPAVLEDVFVFTKLTLRPAEGNALEGYVPKDIHDKLMAGQRIYDESSDKQDIGYISGISEDMILDTGMYRVQAVLNSPAIAQGKWQVVYVNTATLTGVLCVSDDVIDRENGTTYIWKVKESRAVKQAVEIGQHNGYGAVISKGLERDDVYIYNGFTQLQDNELVSIVNKIGSSGAR